MGIVSLARRYPVLSYFGLTYSISWIAALLVIAPRILSGHVIEQPDGLLMFPALLLGPSVAGITLTGVVGGRRGLRNLCARMVRWRVGVHWYAVALLTPPLLIGVVLVGLSKSVSPVFAPHFFPFGIGFGVVAGFFEEIGWTGFALPSLRVRHGIVGGSLLLGVFWGLWHAPVIDFMGAAFPHGAYWLSYFLAFVAAMTAMRVLMVRVATNTGSVFLAQVMHASSTGFLAMLSPSGVSSAQEALWYATYAAVLWVVVAAVVAWSGQRSRVAERGHATTPALERIQSV